MGLSKVARFMTGKKREGGRGAAEFAVEQAIASLSLFGRTAVMAGQEPKPGQQVEWLVQSGWVTVTPTPFGNLLTAAVSFPKPFPAGLLVVSVTQSHDLAPQPIGVYPTPTLAGFTASFPGAAGFGVPIRLFYAAVGY